LLVGDPEGRERHMYLQEEDARDILDDLDAYLVE
jgi:hypothetical protein